MVGGVVVVVVRVAVLVVWLMDFWRVGRRSRSGPVDVWLLEDLMLRASCRFSVRPSLLYCRSDFVRLEVVGDRD